MGNAKGDFRIRRGNQSHNISSDRTASGDGSLVFLRPAEQFVSVTPGSEDFHLCENSAAVDAGKNLALESISQKASALPASGGAYPTDAAADIDGQDRMGETDWDIGADEVETALEGVSFVDAALAGDGTSWKSAFGTIREAVAAARPGEQIWVREGTYELDAQIPIDKPIALYGGFSGTERRLEQRDWNKRPTVLDGRGITSCLNLSAGGVVLDGFVFAFADGTNGGAVLAQNVPGFTIENCRFELNEAANGGGLFARSSSGTLRNCTFAGNAARRNGGAIYTESSALVIANCVFTGNTAGASGSSTSGGGAVYAMLNGAVITNCVFYDNQAARRKNQGGAVYNYFTNTVIANSILWGNTAGWRGDDAYLNSPADSLHCGCCDVDSLGVAGETVVYGDGCFGADPRFCDMDEDDVTLCANSPCLPGGISLALIGARGEGCGDCASPVAPASWGTLKALYR